MFASHSTHARLAGSVLAAGLLLSSASTAAAQSTGAPPTASCTAAILDLSNPSAGDMLQPGGYVIQGLAYDPEAQQGSGIDSLSIFLDSRDAGGLALGQTTPGMAPLPGLPAPSMDSFALTVTLPAANLGGHSIVAYAHS